MSAAIAASTRKSRGRFDSVRLVAEIERTRINLGLSDADVARATGVSKCTLSRMKSNPNRAPDAASVAAFFAWLAMSPAQFISDPPLAAIEGKAKLLNVPVLKPLQDAREAQRNPIVAVCGFCGREVRARDKPCEAVTACPVRVAA